MEGKAGDAHCLRQLKWAAGASDACTSYGFWCTEEQLMLMTDRHSLCHAYAHDPRPFCGGEGCS